MAEENHSHNEPREAMTKTSGNETPNAASGVDDVVPENAARTGKIDALRFLKEENR